MAPMPANRADERSDDADEVDVPAVVEGEAGADSGDHAVVARARELVGVGVDAGGGGGTAEMVAPQAGQKREDGIDWFAALSAEHVGLRRFYFAIGRRWRREKEQGVWRLRRGLQSWEQRQLRKAGPPPAGRMTTQKQKRQRAKAKA